jgi:hypothetical protein
MADNLEARLCRALGLDPAWVTRLIIDTGYASDDAPPTVYATLILDEDSYEEFIKVWQDAEEDMYAKRYTIIDTSVAYAYDDDDLDDIGIKIDLNDEYWGTDDDDE